MTDSAPTNRSGFILGSFRTAQEHRVVATLIDSLSALAETDAA